MDETPNAVKQLYTDVEYTIGSNPEMERQVKHGCVVIGRLRVYSSYNSGLAFVRSGAFPADVVVKGYGSINRFLHNDVVAVQLLPMEQWEDVVSGELEPDGDDKDEFRTMRPDSERLPDGRRITRWIRDTTMNNRKNREMWLAEMMSAPTEHNWHGKKPSGSVIAVLERKHPLLFVARLADDALSSQEVIQDRRFYRFKVFDQLLPHIAVFGRDIPFSLRESIRERFYLLRLETTTGGDIVWAESRFPTARIISTFGSVHSLRANTFAICSAHHIVTDDFSEEACNCIPDRLIIPNLEEMKRTGRRDLRREEFVCSIDPATARDLDDALSITLLPGGYRVGVHIADVSHFVSPGSALDEEGRARATSVYLVDRVYHMLPRKLSEEYCSLHPGSDKLAFSAIFQLDLNGKLKGEWFGKSVIRNRCRLSYDDAQRIIDGNLTTLDALDYGGVTDRRELSQLKERVATSVKHLFDLASKLRAASFERGRLAFSTPEIGFHFEDISNPTHPIGFNVHRQIEANWLVEEFMLLANLRVAQKIVQYLPDQAILRVHPPPKRVPFEQLKVSLARVNIELKGRSNKSLEQLLNSVRDHPLRDEISIMVKNTLSLAKYCTNGENFTNKVPLGHYALGLEWYTHFTSPIRRYADIIVHRQLLCALEIESIVKGKHRTGKTCAGAVGMEVECLDSAEFFTSTYEVMNIADECNENKRAADSVSEASLKLFFCHYLKSLRSLWVSSNKEDPFIPRVDAVVISVAPEKKVLMLYARVVGISVEISLKSKTQKFVAESGNNENRDESNKEETASLHSEIRRKRGSATGGNHRGGERQKSPPRAQEAKITINWGLHPQTNEKVEEEIKELMMVSAVLTIKRNVKGYEEPDMIMDPPWLRDEKRMAIPTSLV
ncbi:DIS3-like exonuclease [Trypanosoma brucei equiperdum]|uniref:DIS3-like exonuclease n=1 Tax=Trypanosoma brucei equiperdum TaxID=630700 RepID=A0A3L6KWM3_9TRYP|nr:DIS3-like exonuclease [Trypanosoma brucei equiperdum]